MIRPPALKYAGTRRRFKSSATLHHLFGATIGASIHSWMRWLVNPKVPIPEAKQFSQSSEAIGGLWVYANQAFRALDIHSLFLLRRAGDSSECGDLVIEADPPFSQPINEPPLALVPFPEGLNPLRKRTHRASLFR